MSHLAERRRQNPAQTIPALLPRGAPKEHTDETMHKIPMYKANAYSAASATSSLAATTIARRDPTEPDVQIEILFCGICHSDLHQVRNEWSGVMPTVYPCVPGHEIIGRVTKVGSAVTKFKPGDVAAVGCMVDSDRTCAECQAGLEQFCRERSLRQTAQVRCEVPLLHRFGFSQFPLTLTE